jgi:hypothetical protein
LSHVSPFDMTYVRVLLVHMARWSSTLAGVVPRQFDHAKAEGATHESITPYCLA